MKSKYGLVLAGGGSKGAYQIGAWSAMRELGIEFEAIAGVSIGSVNGALIAMGNYDNAMTFWNSISVEKGVKINGKLNDPDNLFSRKNWPVLFMEVMKNKGFDASPARDFFNEYIDEEKVRKSSTPLGLVTVKFDGDGAHPVEKFVHDIPKGELVEYLLASADIPLAINIGPSDGRYLDGGTYDNTPITFLRKNGYNRLIVVDIASIKGIAHSLDNVNSEMIYIRPFNLDDLGASFDFSPEMNRTRMQLGYLDTKKAFSVLLGNIYYFEPKVFRKMVHKYGADAVKQMEELAYKMNMNRLQIYSESEFLAELKPLYESFKLAKEEEEKKKQKETEAEEPGKKNLLSDMLDKISTLAESNEDSEPENPDEKKGFLTSMLGKLADDIITGLEKDETESPDNKRSAISSVIDIIAKKHFGEKDFDLAAEILEKL